MTVFMDDHLTRMQRLIQGSKCTAQISILLDLDKRLESAGLEEARDTINVMLMELQQELKTY